MSNNELRTLFEALKEGRYNPLLEDVHGTFRFDIKDVGCWRVTVDGGQIKAWESREPAGCEIECESEDFIDILQGRRNLITAAMQGRVVIGGDLALAQKFHGFIGANVEQRERPQRRHS